MAARELNAGKSTFINALVLHYGIFQDAMKSRLILLAPALISLVNDENGTIAIRIGTQGHQQRVEEAGTLTITVTLTDSLGIGDPRGAERDKLNIENILRYLSSLRELHTICFLPKPNTSRNNEARSLIEQHSQPMFDVSQLIVEDIVLLPKQKSDLVKFLNMAETKDVNVLLLGETGVGKTTFVNAIANYLSYGTLGEAMKGSLRVLAPTLISLVNDENDTVAIRVGSFPAGANLQVGSAGTSNVTSYDLVIDGTRLRLIDTPGIGDPISVKEDDAHFEIILGYLRSLKEIHAICLVMRPNVNRNNVLFEYCLKRILAKLDRGVSKNLIIVFTNTRSTFYSAPETLVCLESILKDMKENSAAIDISFTDDNVFCLDNESFKHLGASTYNLRLAGEALKNSGESWDVSWKECRRFIAYVEKMKPYQVRITVNANEAKKLVDECCAVLMEITTVICDNIDIFNQLVNEFYDNDNDLKELEEELKRKDKNNWNKTNGNKAKIENKKIHLQEVKMQMNEKERINTEQRTKLYRYVQILSKYTNWLQTKSISSFIDSFENSITSMLNRRPYQLKREILQRIIEEYRGTKIVEKKHKMINNGPTITELKHYLEDLRKFKHFCQGASEKRNDNVKPDQDNEKRSTALQSHYKNQPPTAKNRTNQGKDWNKPYDRTRSSNKQSSDHGNKGVPSSKPDDGHMCSNKQCGDQGNNFNASRDEKVEGPSEKDQETKTVAQSHSKSETATATQGVSQIGASKPQESGEGPEGIKGTIATERIKDVTPETSGEEATKENTSAVSTKQNPETSEEQEKLLHQIVEVESINILLISQVGVVTANFINTFANQIRLMDFESVMEERLTVAATTHVAVTDKNKETQKFAHSGKTENQEELVKTYSFTVADSNRTLTLITAPAMGNARSIEEDDFNCAKIVASLTKIKQLHSVCFLFNAARGTSTTSISYCLKQILTRFDKSVSNNVIFILAKISDSTTDVDECLGLLKTIVESADVGIPLKDNVFVLDTRPIKYMLAMQRSVQIDKSIVEQCWNESLMEFYRLLTFITGKGYMLSLKPCLVGDTLLVNEVRTLAVKLFHFRLKFYGQTPNMANSVKHSGSLKAYIGEINEDDEITSEFNIIAQTFNKFCRYLQQNAKIWFNDSYEEYMEDKISKLTGMETDNQKLVEKLRKLKHEHSKFKEMFDQSKETVGTSRSAPITIDNIKEEISKLFVLKVKGTEIKQRFRQALDIKRS